MKKDNKNKRLNKNTKNKTVKMGLESTIKVCGLSDCAHSDTKALTEKKMGLSGRRFTFLSRSESGRDLRLAT
ncbi:hypothetical protein AT705_22220 [Pseudoalteromonas rubra]|uniref:Uncharacterized protein n=1 Tax=Pseudoalteromonas rubra TaxID=43658 RepID=A0A0U3HVV2_9GAMM|nr:hypothetical protein AT705_22220 [Pseudoalteromonas rubra]